MSARRLTLYVPKLDELWYRQALEADPATMSYNMGYDLDFAGYHRDTGCIDFPKDQWAKWYDCFVGREPLRFYAYLARKEDGAWVGEVNYHQNPGQSWHDLGVLIQAEHRGCGYAAEALALLEYQAFEVDGIHMLHNEFETGRAAVCRAHLSAGFSEYRRENGLIELLLTREQYFARQSRQRE